MKMVNECLFHTSKIYALLNIVNSPFVVILLTTLGKCQMNHLEKTDGVSLIRQKIKMPTTFRIDK